jgi:catechol 2,3-dioxygenase-like lactoylglutathione lyase family enzyme
MTETLLDTDRSDAPDRLITHVRHVDLAVPDFATELEFYRNTWGLTPVEQDEGITFLAAEGSPEQYVMRLRQATEKRMELLAFGAKDADDVNTLAERLGRDGVQLVNEPDKLQTPGGGYGFRFFDVDGRTIEISSDVATRQHRKIEEKESIPVRLSHVVINSPQPEVTRAFYERHLAFALSDTLMHPRMGEMMWFLRCNSHHHSIAIARGPHVSMHHASFELRGLDEYMRGTGRVMRTGAEKVWGPGRHMAGNNTFTYFLDPNGNTIEYTTELETIDEDTWHPHLYDFSEPEVSDQWGTANAMNEFVAKKSFNDPDAVFLAPPV